MPGQNAAIAALVIISASLGWSEAHAQTRWPGVSWTKPAGMVETDHWSRECPGDCIMYEGSDEEWPLIIVHAPIIGPYAAAPAAYRTGLAKRTGEKVDQITLEQQNVTGGNLTMGLYELRDDTDDPGEGDLAAVGFVSRGDVTVAVELKSLNQRDLTGDRSKIFSAVLGSVNIDPKAAAAGSQALDRELKTLGDAIAAGYGRGEKAEMFLNVDAGVRNEFQVGGLQLVAYRNEYRLMFLPGGVFIDSHDGVKEFRTPDLAWLKEEKLLGTWKRSGENYIVTRADGSVTTYRPGKKDGQQRSLTADGNRTHWEIAHLTAADLVGSYATIDTTTSGGGSSNMAMVASRSDSKLRLLPGARFEMTREGWAGVLGANITISSSTRNATVTGRYEWDPLSWMITLKGDDGQVTRGPMVPGPGQFTAAARAGGGDWNVLGGTRWWREK